MGSHGGKNTKYYFSATKSQNPYHTQGMEHEAQI